MLTRFVRSETFGWFFAYRPFRWALAFLFATLVWAAQNWRHLVIFQPR